MMGPIASRIMLVLVLVGSRVAPLFAGESDVMMRLGAPDPSLPTFVPASGRGNFTTAVNDNSASAVAARHAAEAMSAKFSDISTSSISNDAIEVAPSEPREPVVSDPPHTELPKGDARAIVLKSSSGPRPSGKAARLASSGEVKAQPRRVIPRNGIEEKGRLSESEPNGGNSGLAAIGQKVGLLHLLTNPALWK
jgi:hypothetical protein